MNYMNYYEKKEIALRVPIVRILEGEGFHVVKNVCCSPFRSEQTPSFRVYPDNRWVDYGMTGDVHRGGDAINLIRELKNLSHKEAVDYILTNFCCSEAFSVSPPQMAPREKGIIAQKHRIDYISEVKHPALVRYAISRGITLAVLQSYCKEVHYTYMPNNMHCFGIGLANDNGGWMVRSAPYGTNKGTKTDVLASGISTIRVNPLIKTQTACVFEGMFNFLSWVVLFGKPIYDVFVLNGKENARYLAGISNSGVKNLFDYADNDSGGREAYNTLVRVSGCDVTDMSGLYASKNLDDLNEYLMAYPEAAR